MKRFLYIFVIIVLAALVGCQKEPTLPSGALSIVPGTTLYIGGSKDSTVDFTINSAYDWRILPTNGFVCEPSNGSAGNGIKITARAIEANNTLDTLLLGDLTFKLKSTKFVGTKMYQYPQIAVGEGGGIVYTEAGDGASTTIKIYSATPDFDIICTDGIACEVSKSDYSKGEYYLTANTSGFNYTSDTVKAGEIGFEVEGKRQAACIEVYRQPALRIERDIILSGTAGSQVSFEVTTPFDFEITGTSSGLSAERGSGNMVIVTAMTANTGDKERLLGSIEIALKDEPSCSVSVNVYQRAPRAAQTIMFHYLGTSLSSYYKTNLAKTKLALGKNIQGSTRVLVFMQNGERAATLSELRYDDVAGECVEEVVKTYKLTTPYTEQALAEQIADMVQYAPAESYGLIWGSHGKGWIPKGGSGKQLLSARDYAIRRKMWTPAPGALQTRNVGDSNATQYDTDELASAIADAGIKLKYLIFDACFMSNVESAYDLRNATEYIVASPCEVMGRGFPYDLVMPQLLLDNGTRFDLDAVCRAFVDHYKSADLRSACSAVIDCAQLEALAAVVKRVNSSGSRAVTLDNVQAYEGISSYYNPTHIFYDLEDYVQQSCTDNAAVEAFTAQLDRTVSSRYHTDTFYSAYNGRTNAINHYSGITTSAPIMLDTASQYRDEWQQTEWYKVTH